MKKSCLISIQATTPWISTQSSAGRPGDLEEVAVEAVWKSISELDHGNNVEDEQTQLGRPKFDFHTGGLAHPTSPLRTAALDLALSDAVKLQDFFYVALSMHGASAAGRDATWAHFTEKLDAYKAKVGEAGSSIMDASIVGACGGFCTEAAANDIVAFFARTPRRSDQHRLIDHVDRPKNLSSRGTRASAAYVARIRDAPTALRRAGPATKLTP